jgi:hypothetical protein
MQRVISNKLSYLIIAIFLILGLCSCSRNSLIRRNLVGVWNLDSSVTSTGTQKYGKDKWASIILYKNGNYRESDGEYDTDGFLDGSYIISSNPKRHYLTITLLPNTEKIGNEERIFPPSNFDILIVGKQTLTVRGWSEWEKTELKYFTKK